MNKMTQIPETSEIAANSASVDALSRVPKTGLFNEVSIPVVSSVAFGGVGLYLGRAIGRFADDRKGDKGGGPFERGLGYIVAACLALLAAAVSIRQTRESKEQAVELAKRSMELEQHNAVLSSIATKPVGTLIGTDMGMGPSISTPQLDVNQVKHLGTMLDAPQRELV